MILCGLRNIKSGCAVQISQFDEIALGRLCALSFVVTATSLSVLLVYQLALFSSVMVEPALPPLPNRGLEPADNPVVAEPPVPPADATEPVEVNKVIPSVIPCVLRYVPRVLCRRSRPLGRIVVYLFGLVLLLCVSLPSLV